MKPTRVLALAACLTAPAALHAQAVPAESVPDAPLASITDRDVQGHMTFLASDLMRGRDTASPEIRLAADYLATRLIMAGAEPMGDVVDGKPTYFAAFPLEEVTPLAEGTSLLLAAGKEGVEKTQAFSVNDDFLLWPQGLAPGTTEAPLVFAGYGIVDDEAKRDDFQGLDLTGKAVLILDGAPDAEPKPTKGLDINEKITAARSRGARAVLVAHAPSSTGKDFSGQFRYMKQAYDKPQLRLGIHSPEPAGPVAYLSDATRDAIAATLGLDLQAAAPKALDAATVRVAYSARVVQKADRNVVGLFRGSDPDKGKEIVVYSAHYDHVGVNARGEIHNGSDDNASGTSALLEIAQAFGQAERPARSVVFLWVSGEEKGLWGSSWFANHAPLPEGHRIVADINMDMVSRNDPAKISMTPSPTHPENNTLAVAALAACQAEGLTPEFDADQFFHRTDSANFAAKGIPIVFFFSGLHPDYHKPTDDFDKADFAKAARVARAAFRLGWQAAQSPEAPKRVEAEKPAQEAAGGSE
jgi:hypothetical protein